MEGRNGEIRGQVTSEIIRTRYHTAFASTNYKQLGASFKVLWASSVWGAVALLRHLEV